MSCANEKCAIADVSAELIKCSGLCGKYYHPSCAGLSRKASVFLKDYLRNFAFSCDECNKISVSDVMIAIQCLKDSISNDILLCQKKVTGLSKKIDLLANGVEESNTQSLQSSSQCLSKMCCLEKKLSDLKQSPRDLNIDFNSLHSDLDKKISALSCFAHEMNKNLNSRLTQIRSDIEEHLQSPS